MASLQSDLGNNSKRLKLYNVEYGLYPDTIDPSSLCPTAPNADNRYCLKASTDTTLIYNGSNQTFTLTAIKNGISYRITEDSVPFQYSLTLVTGITDVSGTLQISQTLTAGTVSPAGATFTYQWQSSTTSNGVYSDISGATGSTYVVSPNVMNKYLKVKITGNGEYAGVVSSSATSSAIANDSNWLTIGNQTWMKTNLNVGTMVAGTTTQTNNSTIEKYCYDDLSSRCDTYGGMYAWNEAMQYSTTEGAQGVCQAGSHIPSDNDWTILETQLGGSNLSNLLRVGGGSGLHIPYGGVYLVNAYHYLMSEAYLWSSTTSGSNAWYRYFDKSYTPLYRSAFSKANSMSIRCVGN